MLEVFHRLSDHLGAAVRGNHSIFHPAVKKFPAPPLPSDPTLSTLSYTPTQSLSQYVNQSTTHVRAERGCHKILVIEHDFKTLRTELNLKIISTGICQNVDWLLGFQWAKGTMQNLRQTMEISRLTNLVRLVKEVYCSFLQASYQTKWISQHIKA